MVGGSSRGIYMDGGGGDGEIGENRKIVRKEGNIG